MSRLLFRTGPLVLLLVGLTSRSPIEAQDADAHLSPSDHALKDRITFRLETDATLRKYDLRVTVAEGVATIRGDVATDAQKTRAARVAKVGGVSRVVTDILVDPDVNRTLADRSKAGLTKSDEKLTDGWIAARVRWLLDRAEVLKGSDVRVQSSDHVVTLSGTVPTSDAQARAVQLARGTDGVVRVVDQLMIS
jgi:hyperosmotically inducible protein